MLFKGFHHFLNMIDFKFTKFEILMYIKTKYHGLMINQDRGSNFTSRVKSNFGAGAVAVAEAMASSTQTGAVASADTPENSVTAPTSQVHFTYKPNQD